MRKDGNVELDHLAQSIADRALLAVQGGVWEWSIADSSEIWHPSLQALLGSACEHSAPSLRKLLCPTDQERLNQALKCTARERSPFELSVTIKGGEEAKSLRMRGGVDPADSQRILAICELRPILVRSQECSANTCTTRGESLQPASAREAMYRSLIERASDMVFRMSVPEGRYEYVSPSAAKVIGYSADELLAEPFIIGRVIHTDFQAFLKRTWDDICHGRIEPHFEYCIIDPDGKTRWITQSNVGIFDERGQIIALEGICRDDTEHRQSELAIYASECKYRALIESAPEAILVLDQATGHYVDCNAEASRLFGFSRSQLLERGPLELSPDLQPDGQPSAVVAARKLAQAAAGLKPVFEWMHRSADNRLIPCEVRIMRLPDPDPNRILFRGSIVDISPRKKVERQLKESESLLRRVVEGTQDAVYVKDQQGRYLMMNSAGARMIGKSVEEVVGKADADVFSPEIAKDIAQLDAQLMQNREHYTFEKTRTIHGVKRVLITSKSPLIGETGELLGLIGVTRDITDVRAADDALRESRALLTSFFEMSSAAMAIYDADGRFVRVNRTMAELFGQCPEWFHGKRPSECLPAELAGDLEASACRVMDGRQPEINREISGALPHMPAIHSGIYSHFPIIGENDAMLGVGAVVIDTTRQKQAELALRESEERFRLLFEAAPTSIVLTDDLGRYTDVNPAHELISGFTAAEMIGKTPNELGVLTPDNDTLAPAREVLAATGRLDNIEFTGPTKTGEQVSILLSTRTIQIGGLRKYLTVSLDITNRKLIESAIRDNEQMLRTFIENAPVSVAMLDRNLCYLAHSRRWLRDMHVDAQTIVIGRPHGEIFPENAARWQAIHKRSLGGASEHCDVDELQRSDGTSDLMRWELQPWLQPDGSVGGLMFFSELITDRVRAERAQRESEERLAEAQRIAHVGDWSWDIRTDAIQWSDEVYRIFGHEPKSFAPFFHQDFIKAVHPDDRDLVAEAIKQGWHREERFAIEHRIQRRDGQERILRLLGQVEAKERRAPHRVFGTVQDITDIKTAEQEMTALRNQIAHAGRVSTMGEMAAGIAHELNQPLAAISLYADGCQNALTAGSLSIEEQSAKLEEIANLANRCGEIIRRLRMFATNREIKRSSVNLAEVVRASIALLNHELRKSETRCLVQFSAEPLPVFADSIHLQQVFLNLIKNAMEAEEHLDHASRRIEVTGSFRTPEQIVVTIRDFGCGMQPDQRDRIFEPFYTTKPTGLGMGLKICQTIIRTHGGEITCQSEPTGGTSFHILLPSLRRQAS
ncbi:PAS domain S-box protein [Anatilimnocola sp. NA78]|uniref:PAS domain-containing sensor histidine kinase n=1 Tax=Anatilimnocola sp. NA78 TaxID=3415683 RepID=UPI003CE58164